LWLISAPLKSLTLTLIDVVHCWFRMQQEILC